MAIVKNLSATFSFKALFYNRTYLKNDFDVKDLSIKLNVKTSEKYDLSALTKFGQTFNSKFGSAAFVSINDPILIRLVEPKAGNTVHTFIEKNKKELVGETYKIVGDTIPPETVNGYKVVIFGDGYDVTLEGFAHWLLNGLQNNPNTSVVSTVIVKDSSGLEAEVSVD